MSSITDRMDLGYFPLQDHEEGVSVSTRQSLAGARIEKISDPSDANSEAGAKGMVEIAKENGMGTIGDVHPWFFWQTRDRATRGMGAWSQAFTGMVVSGGGRYDAKVQPIRDGDLTNDTRFREKVAGWPKCFPRLAQGSLVMMMPGTDEAEQHSVAMWADPRLFAPAAAGPYDAGTLVCDMQPDGEICMDGSTEPGVGGRHAKLQSLVRVIPVAGSIPGLSGRGNILALNYSRSADGLAGLGAVWAPLASGGGSTGPITPGRNLSTSGPGDTVRYNNLSLGSGGFDDDGNEGPSSSGDEKTPCDFGTFRTNQVRGHGVAFMEASAAFGPLHAGDQDDKHRIAYDRDGHAMNSGHVSTGAYFFRSRHNDGPLLFEGSYPNPPAWPLIARTHLSWDGGSQHAHLTGTKSGVWRWWTEVPYVAPDGDTPRGPVTPPGDTAPPGPGRPGGPGTPGPGTPAPPGDPPPPGGGGGRSGPGRPAPVGPGKPGGGGKKPDKLPTPVTPWPGYQPHIPTPYRPKVPDPSGPTTPGPTPPQDPEHGYGRDRKTPKTPITPPTGLSPVRPGRPSEPFGGVSEPGFWEPVRRALGEIVPAGPRGGPGGMGTTEGQPSIDLGSNGPLGNNDLNNPDRRGNVPGVIEKIGAAGGVIAAYSIFHPMQEGFASVAFRPQLTIANYPNFEHNPQIPRQIIKADEITRPQVVVMRSWGAQSASGDWNYVRHPNQSRARGGLVQGGIVFTPPERELEDYFGVNSAIDVTVDPDTVSAVAFAQGVRAAFADPVSSGGYADGAVILEREDSAGSDSRALIVSQQNESGDEVEIMRLRVPGATTVPIVSFAGTGAVRIPYGTSAQVPATTEDGMVRVDTDTGGAARLSYFDAGSWETAFAVTEYLNSSSGVSDAGKPVKLNAAGVIDSSMVSVMGSTDHGVLTGLGDDDHSQYHNDTRGDARYLQLTGGTLTGTLTGTTIEADGITVAGSAGIDKSSFSFDDNGGSTHTVVVDGGIITQWDIV